MTPSAGSDVLTAGAWRGSAGSVKLAVGTAGPGGLSLLSGRRRGWGLCKSAQRSVEQRRLLGSLVTRFGQR